MSERVRGNSDLGLGEVDGGWDTIKDDSLGAEVDKKESVPSERTEEDKGSISEMHLGEESTLIENFRNKDGNIDVAREQVIDAYTAEDRVDEAERGGEFSSRVGEIDRYMLETSGHKEAMARYMADLVGVLVGVKPAALIQISPTELNLEPAELHKMMGGLGLKIAMGWEEGKFFISKDEDTAEQLRQGFHELWEDNQNGHVNRTEIDRRLGRLLGYPETAVNQDFYKKQTFSERVKKLFKKRPDESLKRHYAHSLEHAEEEFEQYEKPIHEFMDKYCPESTKVLKEERTAKGGFYRW